MVQAGLLFGFKTYVLNPRLEKSLKDFHHRAVWRMACMGPKYQLNCTWVYQSIGAAMVIVGMEEIEVYITHLHNTVEQ